MSQGPTAAPYPEFEVCNSDAIDTVVNTVVPGGDRRGESQKTRRVMENMSARSHAAANPMMCSPSRPEHNVWIQRDFFSPCDAPGVDILITHTSFHQLSVLRLIIQS